MCAYLNKPVAQSELLYALLKPLENGPIHIPIVEQDFSGEPPLLITQGKPKQRILLAEDNIVNQKLAIRSACSSFLQAILTYDGTQIVGKVWLCSDPG